MSWHCVYCGKSKDCNGIITLYDIRGGVPMRICVHLSCFALSLEFIDVREKIVSWDKELSEKVV